MQCMVMSGEIFHKCGIAFIRLRKPLQFYIDKYGTPLYALTKLQLLMQKQRNRGQDGAGIATIKLHAPIGTRYLDRYRTIGADYLTDLFDAVYVHFNALPPDKMQDAEWLIQSVPFAGEVLMGHLRYGTHGQNDLRYVHPKIRQSNWISRTLVLAGNFNMTNVDAIFDELVELGQFPIEKSDTVTLLEKIGHFLDEEVEWQYRFFKPQGLSTQELNERIFYHLSISRILQRATRKFDGGWALVGMIGHGDAFVYRDPWGIRPAYYYWDDEIVVAASERPAIQTALNVRHDEVREIPAGAALIVKRDGRVGIEQCLDPAPRCAPCSFERIYFSRGTDRDIYLERKALGRYLRDQVLEAIDYDFENTVFSYIPNTAETAFGGLMEELEIYLNEVKTQKLQTLLGKGQPLDEQIRNILSLRPRIEKIVVKDAKLRTFISDDSGRSHLVSYAYDVTYGIVRNHRDTLVLLDDSIVRGTTLRNSIIAIVSRLLPRRIVIVSSAPQIRYPDCYGIDMSKMHDFIAFQAMIELLYDHNKEHLIEEVYHRCKRSLELPIEQSTNEVKRLYALFSADEISAKIAEMLRPKDPRIELRVIFQTVENLHRACPQHTGDWYFTGNYPTPGGNRVANRAFINYVEKKNIRAY